MGRLRKSQLGLFSRPPSPPGPPAAPHGPAAPASPTGAPGPGLTLTPSASNPAVRRWTRTDKAGKEHYEGDAGLFLRHLRRKGGSDPITHGTAATPHVQHLVDAGHVRLEPHANSNVAYTAHLTATGKAHASRLIRSQAAKRVRAQARMFKALRDALSAPSPTPMTHATYAHPATGERRKGFVHTTGAEGAYIVDHETKEGHRVPHGKWSADDHSAPPTGPAIKDWRAEHPGLTDYPDPETPTAKVKRTPTGLRWTDAEGKPRHGHDRAALRQKVAHRFARLQQAEVDIEDAADHAASDVRLGARSSRAALGAALLAELYGPDSAQARPGRHLLTKPPKPEALADYVQARGLKLKTVRRWAATRAWLEAVEGPTERDADAAAKVAGRALGVSAEEILGRLDATIGMAVAGGMKARDMSAALMQAQEMDPFQVHYEPEEGDDA